MNGVEHGGGAQGSRGAYPAEPPRLILASGSPARTALLSQADLPHEVIVSHVDEDAVTATLGAASPATIAATLAQAKAEAVASTPAARGALVLGCDSVFELDGCAYGKPGTPDIAVERIRRMSAHMGHLHTGHWLVDTRVPSAPAHQPTAPTRGVGAVAAATAHFAPLTGEQIARYVATGEPLAVAGSFTLDGRGGLFIDRVEGDPHAVVGLSLATLRRLLGECGVEVTDLWPQTCGNDTCKNDTDAEKENTHAHRG